MGILKDTTEDPNVLWSSSYDRNKIWELRTCTSPRSWQFGASHFFDPPLSEYWQGHLCFGLHFGPWTVELLRTWGWKR